METIRFKLLEIGPGDMLLDLGCGGGRHAFGALRRGAAVVACDAERSQLPAVGGLMGAMQSSGEAREDSMAVTVCGNALNLPFADASFKYVIASEVLEHIDADADAVGELTRVLAPGGALAVSVPSWLPEKLCWKLSSDYHAPARPGGHVRIYTRSALKGLLVAAGLTPTRSHRAHALHSPYWWLRCAVGPDNDGGLLVKNYHRFLCWDLTRQPRLLRLVERLLDPLIGKSLVLYAVKDRKAESLPEGELKTADCVPDATDEEEESLKEVRSLRVPA